MGRAAGIAGITLCVLLLSASNEKKLTGKLNPSALREDALALRRALEKYHPGIYWYTSREEFSIAWDSLNKKLDKPISEDEFFKLLLPVVAKVKCAHTLFFPSVEMISSGSRFPLDLKFIGEKNYLMSDSSNQYPIPKGSELLSINGKSMGEILNLLLPNLEAQGGNSGWKYVILENDFQNYYHYLIEHTESFKIEYVDHTNGRKEELIIKGSQEKKLRNHWRYWYPDADGAPLKITYRDDKQLAIITVRSFNKGRYKSYQQDFDQLVAQYFKEIREKKVIKLIIDVRGNEGGNQPERLYSYLAKEDTMQTHSRNNYHPKQVRNKFEGSAIVLANERSISAQEGFVSLFKNGNRGLIIGRPTPGCARYLCGGNKHKLVLLNSRFEINIPMHATIRTDSVSLRLKMGAGYSPDFRVDENIDALLERRDVVMEFALRKIK
jgi:hypothetical protein